MNRTLLLLSAFLFFNIGLFADTIIDNSVKGNEIKPFWRKGTGPTIYPTWYNNRGGVTTEVTHDGNNSTSGATLESVLENLSAGDHIKIRGGTYSISNKLEFGGSGTATNPIFISGADGETVIITRPNANQNTVNINNGSYIVFENIEVTGGSLGMRLMSVDHIMIYNCKVHDTGENLISANQNDTNHLYFIDNEMYASSGTGEAFYIGGNSGSVKTHDTWIAGNYVHDLVDTGSGSFQGDGIELKDGSYKNYIKYNYVTNTKAPGIICYGTQKGGTDRNVIESNVIFNNSSDYSLQFAGQVIVKNNLIVNNNYRAVRSANHQNGVPGDIDFINNTVISPNKSMSVSNWDGKSNLVIANNFFYSGISDYIAGSVGTAVNTNNIKVNSLNALVSLNTSGSNKDLRPHPTNGTALIGGANSGYLPTSDIMGRDRTESDDVGAQNSWLEIDIDVSPLTVTEGSHADLKIKLAIKPIGNESISLAFNSGDTDLSLTNGDPKVISFTTSDWNIYQSANISAATDGDTGDGSAVFRISKSSGGDAVKVVDVTVNENDTGSSDHTITASTGVNGSISPSGGVSVANGDSQLFTFTPAANYEIEDVKVDNVSVGSNGAFTISNVTSNKSISVSFKIKTYQIAAGAGAGGSISPSGAVSVDHGASKTFSVTPNGGYEVSDLLVNGSSVGALTSHTFDNVTSTQTIQVSFSLVAVTHTVSAITDSNGSISPVGAVVVGDGNSQTFSFIPNNGYEVDYVELNGSSLGVLSSYTINNVTSDHSIKVFYKFSAVNHSITATSGANGSISPDGNVAVIDGTNKTFSIVPNAGYEIDDVLVDGVSVGTSSNYTFNNVTADQSISVSFKAVQLFYTVTVSSGPNGNVLPGGAVVVNSQETKSFDIQPSAGYQIQSIKVDDVTVPVSDPFVMSNISADHTVSVTFSEIPVKHTITTSAGAGGSVSPSGAPSILEGAVQTFTVSPDGGYFIKDVLVDGNSVGPVSNYTFNNVTKDHTISATFELSDTVHSITVTSGINGLISPSGVIQIADGSSKSFSIEADSSYEVLDVVVDGVSKGKLSTYTFYNVTGDHAISATFTASSINHTISTTSIGNGTVSPTGSVLISDAGSRTFSFVPGSGFEVSDVLVNGVSKGVITSYTFINVLSDQNLEVTFALITNNDLNELLTFSFLNFTPAIEGAVENNKIIATLPKDSSLTGLVASFSHNGVSVEVDGVSQISGLTKNDFDVPVNYVITAEDGSVQTIEVVLMVEGATTTSGDTNADNSNAGGDATTDGSATTSDNSSSGGGGCEYSSSGSDSSYLLFLFLIIFFNVKKGACFLKRTTDC